ncbi:MAG: hypothetical protein H0U26_07600 [Acidimicrobiia bacterium]|nr:hypothetical protein [Acidimicrobiia bacterium]
MIAATELLGAMSWDPGFRGILVVAVGVAVLCGSVYLLLATNSGHRLGFLLALTGLMGWMTIMGVVWSMYGIGYLGSQASWKVEEVNYDALPEAALPEARTVPAPDDLPAVDAILEEDPDLAGQFAEADREPTLGDLLSVQPELSERDDLDFGEWELLSTSDPQTGEAQAAASAYLIEERKLFSDSSGFVVVDAYSRGGKERAEEGASLLDRARFKLGRILSWPLGHPTHYAVVQVRPVIPQEPEPGQPPPAPVVADDAQVISVIMVRDLGAKRLPSVGLTIFSGIVFAVCVSSLKRREKLVDEARAAAGAKG